MKTTAYAPQLSYGTRTRLAGLENHPKTGELCTVIGVLPNPSKSAERQWYDVKFDDCSMGRFLERYLVPADNKTNAA
jgi:hypothetical protein